MNLAPDAMIEHFQTGHVYQVMGPSKSRSTASGWTASTTLARMVKTATTPVRPKTSMASSSSSSSLNGGGLSMNVGTYEPYNEAAASPIDRVAWALCQIIDDDAPHALDAIPFGSSVHRQESQGHGRSRTREEEGLYDYHQRRRTCFPCP